MCRRSTTSATARCPTTSRSSPSCEDLKETRYPGYRRRRENLHMGNVTYHVGDLIDGLHDKLTTPIGRALRHSLSAQRTAAEQGVEPPVVSDAVQHCVEEGISRPSARRRPWSFWSEFPTCGGSWPPTCRPPTTATRPSGTLDEVIFRYPGLEAVTIHRLAAPPAHARGAADPPDDGRSASTPAPASTFTPAPRSATTSSITARAW